jgi:hypothetical protein
VLGSDGLVGRGPLGLEHLLEPAEGGRDVGVLVAQPLEELDLARGRQGDDCQPATERVALVNGPGAQAEETIGQLIGLLARRPAVDDLLGQPSQVLDQEDPEADGDGPQLPDGQRLDPLVGRDVAAETDGLEAAVGMGDVGPGQPVDPRIPRERPAGQLRELPVVVGRQVVADLPQLLIDDVEVVDEPFGSRGDRALLADGQRQGAIAGEQDPAVVGDPGSERDSTPRIGQDGLRRRQRLGVLLQPLDAEQLCQDRLPGSVVRRLGAARSERPAANDLNGSAR